MEKFQIGMMLDVPRTFSVGTKEKL